MGPLDVFFDIIWNIFKKSKTLSSLLGLLALGVFGAYLFEPIKSGHILGYINVIALNILLMPVFLLPKSIETDLVDHIQCKRNNTYANRNLSISIVPLIITSIVVGLMLINISHLTAVYPMNYLKWMAIIELAWTIVLYLICGTILLKEKIRS